MTLSLNEVEALAKKAARGAGYPWGLAEEAGKAVRWLHKMDQDGGAELADLLLQCDGSDLSEWAPVPDNVWSAVRGVMCPITTGAALSDRAEWLIRADLQLSNVARPLLLVPFASWAARAIEKIVITRCGAFEAVCDGVGVSMTGGRPPDFGNVHVSVGDVLHPTAQHRGRAVLTDQAFSVLTNFAGRTYAPATEESRLRGAGAGLADDD